MIPDIRFEAELLRAALLLGRVDAREVIAWADMLLPTATQRVDLLADVAMARPELSTVREVLRPLAEPSDLATLGIALLTFLATDPAAPQALPDRLRVLAQLRREDILDAPIASTIKSFEDRWMLASAGLGDDPCLGVELNQWLVTVRGAAYYRISLEHTDERAAFLGALSRKVVRNRRAHVAPHSGSSAWLVDAGAGGGPTLLLNEALWRIAVGDFSPLPLGSRIPYVRVPAQAVCVLDEATAVPMGAQEASDRLAAV